MLGRKWFAVGASSTEDHHLCLFTSKLDNGLPPINLHFVTGWMIDRTEDFRRLGLKRLDQRADRATRTDELIFIT